ncbi:MAG: nucleotide exchange factor GrpE [Candidatus Magasanikbacteria bacterium]|nr:nucleotide exchange factor GrpE [Candidatus Magasanikbacteria bacterium]
MTDEKTIDLSVGKNVEEKKEEKQGLFHRHCKNCEKVEVECAEYKAGWQRALADYKNLQNEVEKRRGEWAQMSEMQVLEDFLPVYENFKKALGMEHGTLNIEQENWRKGIEHIMKQFGDVLRAHGLEEIKTVGEQLDLKFHEAVGEEVVEGIEVGKIVKEVETGYVMGERVVKAAKVIVAK